MMRAFRRIHLRRLPGFSLLEVLIAASLMAIIGALLLTSLSSSMDAKEAVENTSDRYHLVRQAMGRMVREISMAYLSKHRDAPELRAKTNFKGEDDRIDFTAFGAVARKQDAKQSDQRELSYFIGNDPETQKSALMRREQVNPGLELDEGGRTQVLLTDCKDLEFAFWDATKEDWVESWDAENAATLDRLPQRVRIRFTAVMEQERDQEFYTQTEIFLWQAPIFFHN